MSNVSVPDYSGYDVSRVPLDTLLPRRFGSFDARIVAILIANHIGEPMGHKVMVVSHKMLVGWVGETHALGELNQVYQGTLCRNGTTEVIRRGLDTLVQLGHLASTKIKKDTYYAIQQSFYDALMADVR